MNRQFWHRNASTVLTCLGGVRVVVTSVMAVKATPKALKKIETAEKEKGEKLSKWEKMKVAGPSYVPAVMIGAATVTCVIGANLLTSRRQANIASAYALVDESYKQYQNKVKEIYGDEAHRDIMELIAAEKAENMAVQAPGYGMVGRVLIKMEVKYG